MLSLGLPHLTEQLRSARELYERSCAPITARPPPPDTPVDFASIQRYLQKFHQAK